MDKIFDAVVIDTSVLENHQFDFLGLTSQTLPAFYDLLLEKDIILLNNFVLENEVKKHIPRSALIERTEGLEQTFRRNKDFLKLIKISAEESIAKLKELNLKEEILQEYQKRYSDAVMLPLAESSEVFIAYFLEEPPFNSSNNKKSEFPDAFIIKSIKKYVEQNQFSNILVISNDRDWHNSFETTERISVCNTIDEAILVIQNAEKIMPIISENTEEILSSISFWADCEAYDIPEYETVNGVDIKGVTAERIYDFIPFKVSSSSVLFKCTCDLKVNGIARILDEDRSYYDKEDRKYYFVSYSDIEFENAEATVECEIKLAFSDDETDISADIENTRIITKFDVDLELKNASISVAECSEDDLALEALREDMGL